MPRLDRSSVRRWRLAVAVLAAVVTMPAHRASAQAPPRSERGAGLLPTRDARNDTSTMTKEEILQRFDLDADGRIDEGEAETARARMRRDRIETLLKSGIDPLTGRPRDAAAAPAGEPAADDDLLLVPGKPDDAAREKPAAKKEEKKPTARPPATVPYGRAPAITGGVRAGAPAVRPGYGALAPKQDLNAGRPRETLTRPAGGPLRTGAQPATGPVPRGMTPRPATLPQRLPRVTAEDIGR